MAKVMREKSFEFQWISFKCGENFHDFALFVLKVQKKTITQLKILPENF